MTVRTWLSRPVTEERAELRRMARWRRWRALCRAGRVVLRCLRGKAP